MSYKSCYTGQQIDETLQAVNRIQEEYNGLDNLQLLEEAGGSDLIYKMHRYPKYAVLSAVLPYYTQGMKFVYGNAFCGESGYFTPTDKTLDATSTGDEKALYQRFMQGLPPALIVPVSSTASSEAFTQVPFQLTEGITAPGLVQAVYTSAVTLYANKSKYAVTVTVNYTAETVALQGSMVTPA